MPGKGARGDAQAASILLCNVVIKLGRVSQSEGISSLLHVMTLANSLDFIIHRVLQVSSQFRIQTHVPKENLLRGAEYQLRHLCWCRLPCSVSLLYHSGVSLF